MQDGNAAIRELSQALSQYRRQVLLSSEPRPWVEVAEHSSANAANAWKPEWRRQLFKHFEVRLIACEV
jgi:hypothetical protein